MTRELVRSQSFVVCSYDAASKAVALADAKFVDEVMKIHDEAVRMKTFAEITKDHELVNNATEIHRRAERKLGELIDAQRKSGLLAKGTRGQLEGKKPGTGKGQGKAVAKVSGGAGTATPETITLEQAGVSKNLARRANKAFMMPEQKFEADLSRRKEKAVTAITGTQTIRGTEGTGEFERYTPSIYIAAVRAAMGEIDLDPATCEQAQKVVKALRYYTVDEDGLSKPWEGRVWLNPPYHRKLQPLFIDKLIAELKSGRTTEAIVLTNNCTDTDWFHTALSTADAVCFAHGRIPFYTPDGTDVAPTQGQAFFYYGPNVEKFQICFADIGPGVKPIWSWLGDKVACNVAARDRARLCPVRPPITVAPQVLDVECFGGKVAVSLGCRWIGSDIVAGGGTNVEAA
jgi:ParB family chromosome partitioning protein